MSQAEARPQQNVLTKLLEPLVLAFFRDLPER